MLRTSGALLICVFFVQPLVAQSNKTAARNDANSQSAYQAKLVEGHHAFLKGNHAKALEAYLAAKEISPGTAEIYCAIGWAQARLDRFDEALSTLQAAVSISGDKDPRAHGNALFLIAVLDERHGALEEAKSAWMAYLSYAEKHGKEAPFAASASARIDAIDKWRTLRDQYKVVRERIASK